MNFRKEITQRLGRKHYTGRIIAEFGGVECYGETKEEAKVQLEKTVQAITDNSGRRDYIFMADGTVFCLYWNMYGWCYDIMSASRSYPAGCTLGGTNNTSHSYAYESMLNHARQYGEITGPWKALQKDEDRNDVI